jgi:hypothetical protein
MMVCILNMDRYIKIFIERRECNIHWLQLISCSKQDEEDSKSDKIVVSEKNDSSSSQNNFSSVLVKAKLRNKKQLILKRLMLFGLKPSLRMAALKMLTYKKKILPLTDSGQDEEGNENWFFKKSKIY